MVNSSNASAEVLKKVKEKEFEILCAVDDFCKDNDIKYSLAYGTLLGAVRHGGFIPWDDDIDICMDKENYDKFILLWEESKHENLILQNKQTDKDFSQLHTKIRLDNTAFLQQGEQGTHYHKGIFIDVFPYCRGPQSGFERFSFKIKGLFLLLFARDFAPPKASFSVKLFSSFCLKTVPRSKHYSLYKKLLKSVSEKYSDKNRPYYQYGDLTGYSRAHPYDMFDSYIDLEFENRLFPCVSDTDTFLKIWYGDYMQLPPEEERTWKHTPVLIDFEKNYEE